LELTRRGTRREASRKAGSALEKEQLFLLAEPGGDSRGVVVVGVRAVFESDLR
jgi:hypothetical protein